MFISLEYHPRNSSDTEDRQQFDDNLVDICRLSIIMYSHQPGPSAKCTMSANRRSFTKLNMANKTPATSLTKASSLAGTQKPHPTISSSQKMSSKNCQKQNLASASTQQRHPNKTTRPSTSSSNKSDLPPRKTQVDESSTTTTSLANHLEQFHRMVAAIGPDDIESAKQRFVTPHSNIRQLCCPLCGPQE